MPERTIVLAGGSGFLGNSLSQYSLERGWRVVNLTRTPRRNASGVVDVAWDGKTVGDWAQALDGAAAIVNLTGRSVDCRHTADNRRFIIESRVNSVAALGAATKRCAQPPPVWIQAASLAIYGNPGDEICDENAPVGGGFSVHVCQEWESTLRQNCPPEVRSVVLRIGFVLGRDGGALATLASLARKGLGGTVGSGKQWISWLHIEDFNRMVVWAIEQGSAAGAYNATSPDPARNKHFMRQLRRTLGVWFGPPAPAFGVRIGAYLMGTEPSLALEGRRCVPARLRADGFTFQHADLAAALADLLT